MTAKTAADVLRRGWVSLLLAVLIAAAAAGLLQASRGPEHTVDTLVRVQEAEVLLGREDVPDPSHSDRFIADELELLTSRSMARAVASRARLPYEVARAGLDAEQVAATDVVRLSATAATAEEALSLSRAQLAVYVERRQLDVAAIQRQRLVALQSRISGLERDIIALGPVATLEVRALRAAVADLRAQVAEVRADQADRPYAAQILDEPHLRDDELGLDVARAAIAAGLLAGVLIGVLLLVRDGIRRPVHDVEEVRALGVDVFPHIVAGRHVRRRSLLPAEAAQVLAGLLSSTGAPPRVLVTGTDAAADVSLAEFLGEALRSRWPATTLRDHLVDGAAALHQPDSSDPSATASALPDASAEPEAARAGGAVSAEVVMTEPPGPSDEPLLLAPRMTHVVLTTTVARSRRSDVQAAVSLLRGAGAPPPLVVLVD